jgi:hypothetical protein
MESAANSIQLKRNVAFMIAWGTWTLQHKSVGNEDAAGQYGGEDQKVVNESESGSGTLKSAGPQHLKAFMDELEFIGN